MRTSALSPVSLVLIQILGLVSCSPDRKPASESLQDSFKVAVPLIKGEAGATPLLDSKSVATTFSTENALFFPSLENRDFAAEPVTIAVRADCKGHVQASAESMTFENTSEIRLRDLLPVEILLHPEAEKQPTHCLLSFKVTNHHGSVHRFTTPNLSIIAPASSLDIELRSPDPGLAATLSTAAPIAQASLPALRIGRTAVDASKETVFLLCEGFRTNLPAARLETEEGLGTLAQLAPIAYSGRVLVDPTVDPVQICRIVSEANDGGRKIRASRQFLLQFSAPRLKIASKIDFDGYAPDGMRLRIPVFTASIHNPYSVAIPAAVPKGGANSIALQGVVQDGPFAVIGITVVKPLRLELEGATALEDPDLLKFVVDPGQTVTIRASTSVFYQCQDASGRLFSFSEGFLGFYFHLDRNEFSLLQTPDNRLEGDGSFTVGSREPFLDPPASLLPARPLPYWAPWTHTVIFGVPKAVRVQEPVDLRPIGFVPHRKTICREGRL